MRVVLLGTAAGGGFPQWNCWCPTCRVARVEPHRAVARSQSSAAISPDGERWFLLNASPDVRAQLSCLPEPPSSTEVRQVPFDGIVLTDAELDHTLGIVLLREARRIHLHATSSVASILSQDSRILPVTRAFAEVILTELAIGRATPLKYQDGQSSGITIEPLVVPAGPPRFAPAAALGHTVGLVIRDAAGRSCAFVPGCGELTPALLRRLNQVDLLLFDGTFWADDELISLGIGERRAREMDHLPVEGADGSLVQLARLDPSRKVYTHMNNTNPMLLEDSPERVAVERAGLLVGHDGMSFVV